MSLTEDDEWEYEYHDTETKDYYIPLDLSNVPSAKVPITSQGKPGHPTLLQSRLRALNARQGFSQENPSSPANSQEPTMGEMQIIGLHTDNPLVMYSGQLLSCQWASTIGTDMLFVKPDAEAGTSASPPLRSLPSVDLLGLGTAKLIARVATLRPKDEVFENEDVEMDDGDEAARVILVPPEDPAEQKSDYQGYTEPAPGSFLAQLNEAKAERGEQSRFVISKTVDSSRVIPSMTTSETIPTSPSAAQASDSTIMRDGEA